MPSQNMSICCRLFSVGILGKITHGVYIKNVFLETFNGTPRIRFFRELLHIPNDISNNKILIFYALLYLFILQQWKVIGASAVCGRDMDEYWPPIDIIIFVGNNIIWIKWIILNE